MSDQEQNREPRKPGTLISILTIVGLIVGSIFTLVALFDIHTNGIVPGIVGGIVLILVWAIPGILIGLLIFRGFKNKASSLLWLPSLYLPPVSGEDAAKGLAKSRR